MRIIIEVDEKIYAQALADGWNKRTGEHIGPEELNGLDNKSDFVWGIEHLNEDDFELNVEE